MAHTRGHLLTEDAMRIFARLFVVGALLYPFAGAMRAQTIGCSSDDGHRHYCKADTRNGVTLTKQTSSAGCQEGYS